ncbi:MAG: flagellar hook-length control protein FliK [Alphaproteobacteria bacterium]
MTGTSTVLGRTLALLGNAGKHTEEQAGCSSAASGDSADEGGFTQLVDEFSAVGQEDTSGETGEQGASLDESADGSKPEKLLASLDAILQSINHDTSSSASADPDAEEAPPLPSWQSPPPVEIIPDEAMTSALDEELPPDYDDPQLLTEEITEEEAPAPQLEAENAASMIMPVAAEFAGPLPLLSSAAADMAKFFSDPPEVSEAETPDAEEIQASSLENAPIYDEPLEEITELPFDIDADDLPDYGLPPLPETYLSQWRSSQPESASKSPTQPSVSIAAPPDQMPELFAFTEAAENEALPQFIGTGTGIGAGTGAASAASDNTPGEAARELQTLMGDMKVSIARQETHITPTMLQSPTAQLANRITGEIYGASPAGPSAVPQSITQDTDGSGSTVKVLQLRLDPPELGALTVRMSLKQNVLTLQVEATRPETASLIERDREALSGLLRSAGYSVDGLSVQMTPATTNSAMSGNQSVTGQQLQFSGQQAGEGTPTPGGALYL